MVPTGCKVELNCPAKINLSLAILGRQKDGFHALHSVVTQTQFGDDLRLEWRPDEKGDDCFEISGKTLPPGETTLSHAVKLFRQATGLQGGRFLVHLRKRIPIGAGLGGGSSNGVAVLRAIRDIFGQAVHNVDWSVLASTIGSDCPLFLQEGPVTMEGRGERIRTLDPELATRFRGQAVFLFKPGFSINTGEAYRRLAKAKQYHSQEEVLAGIEEWKVSGRMLPNPLNDFESLMEGWMPGLAVVLHRLRDLYGLDARMSGSGSACFVFPKDPPFVRSLLKEELARAWGESYWIVETLVK